MNSRFQLRKMAKRGIQNVFSRLRHAASRRTKVRKASLIKAAEHVELRKMSMYKSKDSDRKTISESPALISLEQLNSAALAHFST